MLIKNVDKILKFICIMEPLEILEFCGSVPCAIINIAKEYARSYKLKNFFASDF